MTKYHDTKFLCPREFYQLHQQLVTEYNFLSAKLGISNMPHLFVFRTKAPDQSERLQVLQELGIKVDSLKETRTGSTDFKRIAAFPENDLAQKIALRWRKRIVREVITSLF
jgi:hypothetical protein